jgi:hypothetical protein
MKFAVGHFGSACGFAETVCGGTTINPINTRAISDKRLFINMF